MKVLVADDDMTTLFLLQNIVVKAGHEVVCARNGQEAWEALQTETPPAIAVVDWMMPEMDGVTLCERVRASETLSGLYFILVTTRDTREDAVRGLEAGADDFLSKPVDPAEFRSRLVVGIRTATYQARLAEYAHHMEELAQNKASQVLHAERLALLGTLAAGLAHEVANPLQLLAANIEFLMNDWDRVTPAINPALAPESARPATERALGRIPESLAEMQEGMYRAMQLLREFKDFARKDDGQLMLQSAVDLNQCVEKALRLCRNRLKYTVKVQTGFAVNLPRVRGNARQLEQVFTNLFINAADAMEEQGGGKLAVRTELKDSRIVCTVEDSGPGIPETKLLDIWEPFFTTKASEKGTGLGLSIVRGIIADHRGDIHVENKANGGARFRVRLPVTNGAVRLHAAVPDVQSTA